MPIKGSGEHPTEPENCERRDTFMARRTTQQETEENAIRTRMAELQQELNTLQARLQALARAREQPPQRHVRIAFQLGASPPREPSESAPVTTIPSAVKKPMDPLERVAQSSRGTFFFAPKEEGVNQPVALWLRTDPALIAELGAAPDMEFRGAVFTGPESGVVLVAVLLRLGPEEAEDLYEAWIDASEEDTRGVLEALAEQEVLEIRLYGDECRLERVLQIANQLQALAARARKLIVGKRPWSADSFHEARTALYKQYPTVRALWRALRT